MKRASQNFRPIVCLDCGRTTPRRGPTQRYCLSCSNVRARQRSQLWAQQNPLSGADYTCAICKKKFNARPSAERIFCSRKCYAAAKTQPIDITLAESLLACGMRRREVAAELGCTLSKLYDRLPRHGVRGYHPRYKDGSSPERQRLYASGVGKAFLRAIYARDQYRCVRCSAPKRGSGSLHVHHIHPWAGNQALRFDPSNVVTLCRSCHHWVHSNANVSGEYLPTPGLMIAVNAYKLPGMPSLGAA